MKITKSELRRIIKEEKQKLQTEMSHEPLPGEIGTDMEVPGELFFDITDFLEELSDQKIDPRMIKKEAAALLLRIERQVGVV